MKIRYLFSGVDKENGFNREQEKYLKKDIKQNLIITFIPSIFDDNERNNKQFIKVLKYFEKINIKFKEKYLIDNRVSICEAKKYIQEADVIYLLGGSPFLQMKKINEYGLKKYIKDKSCIVIGVSAGSMNQAEKVIYKDEYENNRILNYEGLGISPIYIYPHLDFNDIELLKEIFEVSKSTKVCALPNQSFVRIINDTVEFVGEYYIVENGTIDIKGNNYITINHLGTLELETKRLILRKTKTSDLDEFFYIQLNPSLRKYLGQTKLGNDIEKNKKYFDEKKYSELNYYRWTIVKKEDDKILGTIYLNIHDEKAKVAGIDYWIRKDEWNKGYTTEASKCILDFAFQKLDLNRIESCGSKNNPGTWMVMKKIGLKYEGTRKQAFFYYYGGIQDLVLYGLTKDEYLNAFKGTSLK